MPRLCDPSLLRVLVFVCVCVFGGAGVAAGDPVLFTVIHVEGQRCVCVHHIRPLYDNAWPALWVSCLAAFLKVGFSEN